MMCLVAAVLLLARGSDSAARRRADHHCAFTGAAIARVRGHTGILAQLTPMLLALLCASWFCARWERPAAAGLWLALAALLKLYPAAAGGYFLFGRRWRALGWTIGFFAAGVLLTNPARWIELVTRADSHSALLHGARRTYRVPVRAKMRCAIRRHHDRRGAALRSPGQSPRSSTSRCSQSPRRPR